MTERIALLLCALFLACTATAQQRGSRTVPVRVVNATIDSVWLNHGRDIGLVVGDRVRLFPPGGGDVEVVVRSVTHSSARCEPAPGVPVAPVGTSGEAEVPTAEPKPPSDISRPDVPAHRPWTRPVAPRNAKQPLLVPTFGRRPEERQTRWRGRLFAIAQANRDRQGGDSDYLLLRSGLRTTVSNLFGAADEVRLAGEWSLRDVSIEGRNQQTDQTGRLDLASVTLGNQEHEPFGFEVGRFLSRHLPEIGLVDGAEVVLRYQGGVRIGGGAGAYPRPFPARNTGDDVGVHAFVDYVADDRRSFAAALGVQKTWHRGESDRDLVIARTEWRPSPRWTLLGNARVDLYTGNEAIETTQAELTELLVQARWRGDDVGASLVGSHFSWPELRRAEFQLLSPELVLDGKVDRVALSGWWKPIPGYTLRLRGDRFEDQARDGTSARADIELREVLLKGSSLRMSAFRSDGSYTSGPGASATLRQRIADANCRISYRWHRYTLDSLATGPETRIRESVQLGCSWQVSPRCDLDLHGERWFGDGQNTFSIGFFVQWRL